jgi:hypothetical protein
MRQDWRALQEATGSQIAAVLDQVVSTMNAGKPTETQVLGAMDALANMGKRHLNAHPAIKNQINALSNNFPTSADVELMRNNAIGLLDHYRNN